jgi:pimeloyl-ACP methyl ester carboxylesterase
MQDVLDWTKIPLGTFQKSKIYKNIEPVFKEDDNIDYVVGHSAGGSATLELQNNLPDRKITSVTYNAPVFERASTDITADLRNDNKPLRFASGFDPVSALDMNARTTYKAPEINLDIVKNVAKTYTNPSLDDVINTVKSGFPDPLMGQHNMQGTYSIFSTATDFIVSGAKAIVAGNTLGAVVL